MKLHSQVRIITNSSSELFCIKEENTKENIDKIKHIIRSSLVSNENLVKRIVEKIYDESVNYYYRSGDFEIRLDHDLLMDISGTGGFVDLTVFSDLIDKAFPQNDE